MSKRKGKVSLTWLLVIVGVGVVGAAFFFRQSSPSQSATLFLDALARGDAETLTEYTYLEGQSQDEILESWQRSVNIGEYYRFLWAINNETMHGENDATVSIGFVVDADSPASFEENFQIPMTKEGEVWKVDLSQMTREIYPAMPR